MILRLCSVFALTASAWAQVGAIEGVVKWANGALAKGAVIQIEREDTKIAFKSCKTDKNGRYSCPGLPVAVYRLSLIVNGHVVDSVDHVRTHPGNPTPINFVIKMPAARIDGPPGAATSGGP
jgi:hypothetical protein